MKKSDFDKELDRAIEVASRERARLLALPGVAGVGAGPQRRKGKLTGHAAVTVIVRKKLSLAELEGAAIDPLPDQIDGIAVDIEELGKPVENAALRDAQRQAIAAKEAVVGQWLAQPNVTGMGVGYKMVKGKRTGTIALRVYVEEKLDASEIRKRKLIAVPKTIEGVPTDVVVMPRQKPTLSPSGSRADVKDPLVGGCSIGTRNRPFWRGTYGATVFDVATGARRVLSNEHVLDGAIGEAVIQPAPIGLDDAIEVGFQLDICNPVHFFRLDTPNTTLGTILAGGAAAAAVAAALSDEIDPTRRGQDATPVGTDTLTLGETHTVRLNYPQLPLPGVPFKIDTKWEYTRHTNQGDKTFGVAERKVNPHTLDFKGLVTDKRTYAIGETIRLIAALIPSDRKKIKRCNLFHCVALLTPVRADRLFPIVLRESGPGETGQLLGLFAEAVQRSGKEFDQKLLVSLRKNACFYSGEFVSGQGVPVGPWRQYLHVQTVNDTPLGMKPEVAAQTIGGLPVSQNMKPTLDVACGPFVFEDGTFDIELI